MYPDQKMDEIITRLKRSIEKFVITTCIIIIAICLVYLIVRTSKGTTPKIVAYEKFKTFSMPIGDVTGTEDYEEATIATYTDDWGIRYNVKERTK
jgi:hypothetical protein